MRRDFPDKQLMGTDSSHIYIRPTDEDGRYKKVMYGVRLLAEEEAAQYTPPPECKDWLEYIRFTVHLRPWMCGCCLCEDIRVGADKLVGVLVRDHELMDSRIFATHICHKCYERFRNTTDQFITFAYLVPIGLPVTWQPRPRHPKKSGSAQKPPPTAQT